jgi:hypothetical protein
MECEELTKTIQKDGNVQYCAFQKSLVFSCRSRLGKTYF